MIAMFFASVWHRGAARVAVFVLAMTPLVLAQALHPVHGRAELISEESAVHPGQQIWLGLYFTLENGWHTYWVNPGDSGQPAFVRWQLPTGWQAGAMLWPVPERIPDHSAVDYGYQNDVLLIAPTRAPAHLSVGSTVDMRASVEWLVCRDLCVPVQTTVDLPLPVIAGTGIAYSRWHDLFEKTREEVPRPAPKSWKIETGSEAGRFIVQFDAGRPLQAIGFFPLDPNQVNNEIEPLISPYALGLRVILTKSDQFTGPISHFRGVIVEAPGHSYTFDAPVVAMPSNPAK